MKTLLFALIALATLVLSPQARSQTTTFSVIKATASLPGTYVTFDGNIGGTVTHKFTLTTKSVINLAQGLDVNTPVPKDVVLGFAGVFSSFATHGPNNNSPMKLVVFRLPSKNSMTGVGTKLAPVAFGGNRLSAENVVINKYKRVSSGFLSFERNAAIDPNMTGGFFQNINYPGDLNSIMLLTGTTTRTPNTAATAATLKVKTMANAAGTAVFAIKDGAGNVAVRNLVVSKGKFTATGKILGTFDE